MAIVTIINDVLGESITREAKHERFIDYLQDEFKEGFNQPVEVLLNGVVLEVNDFDVVIADNDEITMIFKPADPVSILISIAVSMAVNYIAQQFIDEPSMPTSQTDARGLKNPQSVYSLTSNNNSFASGQVIPVSYGKVRSTPSLIAPPYRKYIDNQEVLFQLMCIGNGKYNIDEVQLGETSSDEFRDYDVIYTKLDNTNFGLNGIETAVNDQDYSVYVKTMDNVENVDLRGTLDRNDIPARYATLGSKELEIFDFMDGTRVDITMLQSGSEVTISGAATDLEGTYIVDYVYGNSIFMLEKVGEPSWNGWTSTSDSPAPLFLPIATRPATNRLTVQYPNPYVTHYLISGGMVTIEVQGGATTHHYIDAYTFSDQITYTVMDLIVHSSTPLTAEHIVGATVKLNRYASTDNLVFKTIYGKYSVTKDMDLMSDYELDIVFPQGLYDYNSTTGAYLDKTVSLNLNLYKNGSLSTTKQLDFVSNDPTPLRQSLKYALPTTFTSSDTFSIELERLTSETTTGQGKDLVQLQRFKMIYEPQDNTSFGNITALQARIKATNAVSSLGQSSINVWATRSDVNNTVKDVITDIVTNTEYGAGLSPTILNLPTTTEVVNGAFENEMSTAEALRVAGNAGRYHVKQDGNEITITKDSEQTLPVFMFNETNMIKDSLTTSYSFGKERDIDGYRVLFRSPTTFQEEEALYPATSDRPEVVELWGCTDYDVAFSESNYLWEKYLKKRNTIEFKTDYQGYIPQYMDKIEVSHNLFKNSQASGVVSESITVSGTRSINLADDVQGTPNQVIIIDELGKPQSYAITAINGNNITVTMSDSVVLYTDFTRDRSKVSLGTSSSMSKEYTIQSIKPAQDNTMSISAINYDPSVYDWADGWVGSGTDSSPVFIPYTSVSTGFSTFVVRINKTVNMYNSGNIIGTVDGRGTLTVYTDATKTTALHTVTHLIDRQTTLNYTTSLDSVFIELETTHSNTPMDLFNFEVR